MKKVISIVVITLLFVSTIIGCSGGNDKSTNSSKPTQNTTRNNSQSTQNNSQSTQNNSNQNNSNPNNNNQNNSQSNSNSQYTQSQYNDSNQQSSNNIVQIVNDTGTDIYELYAVTYNYGSWGSNILGNGILYSGSEFDIKVSVDNPYWNLMVVDYYGNTVTWTDLDLTSISQIDLYVDQTTGQIMAQYK